MPYKRNYRKRRVYKKRVTRVQKVRKMMGQAPTSTIDKIANGVGTVATIAKTVAGIVSMINVEDKYIDTAISHDLSVATPTSAIVLNAIAQGNDYNQRNGNKVLDKCLQVNLRLFLDPTATALATQLIRIVILMDKKPQIGALTWDTVYEPNNTTTGLIDKNTAGDRVVVLADKKFVFNGGNNRYFYKKFYHNLERIHTQYTGSSSTAFEQGTIYMLTICDLAGAAPNMYIRGHARFCYADN